MATPALRLPEPSVVVPSLNVTVPVATDGVTVAVRVTDDPYPDGFAEDVSFVDVLALLTVCVNAEDVLLL